MFPCTTLPYRGSLPIKPKVPILKRPAGTHPFRSDHLEIAKARAASRAHSQGCLVGRSTTGRGGAGDKNGRSDDDDCYSEGAADRPTWCIEVPLKGGWYMLATANQGTCGTLEFATNFFASPFGLRRRVHTKDAKRPA